MNKNSFAAAQVGRHGWHRPMQWLALVALMILTRPYQGLYHDAYLYTLQALRRLQPAELGHDLLFVYGNQDSFTVFTTLYAPLVQWLGPGQAGLVGWAMAVTGWLAALSYLSRQLFADRHVRFVTMAATIVLMPYYGTGVFSYGEGFVSPRPFAEAFGMLAFAAITQRRYLTGTLLTFVAAGLHPITGLGVAAISAGLALRSPARFLMVAAVAGALALAAAAAGLVPFSWLLQTMDAEWRTWIDRHIPFTLVTNWGWNGLFYMVLPLVSLLLILKQGPVRQVRFAKSVIAVCAFMMLVSVIGADLFGNRLIAAIQTWRCLLWLALVGNLLSVGAVLALRPGSPPRLLLLLALALSAAEHAMWVAPTPSAVAAVLALAAHLVPANVMAWRWLRGLIFAIALLPVAAVATLLSLRLLDNDPMPIVRLGLIAIALLALIREPRRALVALPVVTALVGAIIILDTRGPWKRYVESPGPAPEEIRQVVAGKRVYWEDALEFVWFKLQTPLFYTCLQHAGALFFREQMVEFTRRARVLKQLNSTDFSTDMRWGCPMKADTSADGPTDRMQFVRVCAALPELDFIVLQTGVEGAYRHRWDVPDPSDIDIGDARRTFYVYDCGDFR